MPEDNKKPSDGWVKWGGWGVAAAALIYAAGVNDGQASYDEYADTEATTTTESTTTTTEAPLEVDAEVSDEALMNAADAAAPEATGTTAYASGVVVGTAATAVPAAVASPPPVYLQRPYTPPSDAYVIARPAATPDPFADEEGDETERVSILPEPTTSTERPSLLAEAPAASDLGYVPPAYTPPASLGGRCAENGSCYGDISVATGAPKTVAVRGYYRKDGTYVRGHYRSK